MDLPQPCCAFPRACVGHCSGRRRWLSGSALTGDTAFVLKKALFLDLVLSVWELVPDV